MKITIYIERYQVKILEKMLLKKVAKYKKEINKIAEPTEYRRSFYYGKMTDALDILDSLNNYNRLTLEGRKSVNEARTLMKEHPVVKYSSNQTDSLKEPKNG